MTHRRTTIVIGALAIAVIVASVPAAAQKQGTSQRGAGCNQALTTRFEGLEAPPLTEQEIEEMVFLRQEEKLARDVYLTLSERWQLPIFGNIANAEQRHMDAVLLVLDAYDVADPVVDDAVGKFTNSKLAGLYGELVASGDQTLTDALTAGATIEDMDLADVYRLLELTSNPRVSLVAENLAKGSRNHLRAYVGVLTARDGSYAPRYLQRATFDSIMDSEFEAGILYDESGGRLAACGGGGPYGRGMRGAGAGQGTGKGFGGQGRGGCGRCGFGKGAGGQGRGRGPCAGSGPRGPVTDDGAGTDAQPEIGR
jgi:hypothetical protein